MHDLEIYKSAQKFKEVIRYQVTVKFTVPVITMQQTNRAMR